MAEALSDLTSREIPYVYVRETRKLGGHKEVITGDKQNPFFKPGRRGLVMEDSVNFAKTTVYSILVQREAGYNVRHAATIVFYDHKHACKKLDDAGIDLTFLFTLRELLAVALENGFKPHLVKSWISFLNDPMKWQREHGLSAVQKEGAQ